MDAPRAGDYVNVIQKKLFSEPPDGGGLQKAVQIAKMTKTRATCVSRLLHETFQVRALYHMALSKLGLSHLESRSIPSDGTWSVGAGAGGIWLLQVRVVTARPALQLFCVTTFGRCRAAWPRQVGHQCPICPDRSVYPQTARQSNMTGPLWPLGLSRAT